MGPFQLKQDYLSKTSELDFAQDESVLQENGGLLVYPAPKYSNILIALLDQSIPSLAQTLFIQ